ncbi:MAG: hypothetical protein GF330_00075, partial [Candidatus Eisenbacteria bacterium]|nr:hypothetical protein [Candidatus Eisenbacteria bacterium]
MTELLQKTTRPQGPARAAAAVAPGHPAAPAGPAAGLTPAQVRILGDAAPRPAPRPLAILGLTAWREFWSMGDG